MDVKKPFEAKTKRGLWAEQLGHLGAMGEDK